MGCVLLRELSGPSSMAPSQLPADVAVTENMLRVGNLSCPETHPNGSFRCRCGAGAHCEFLRRRSEYNAIPNIYAVSSYVGVIDRVTVPITTESSLY